MSRRRDQRKKWMKRKRGSQKEDSQPEQRMSSWVVSYLDILGYRSLLHKIDLPPDFETEEQRRVVEQAFIPPIRLRRRLITLVRRSIEGLSEPANLDHIPRESRKIVADWHKAKVMRWDGPDNIVLATSLENRPGHFPIRGLYNLIVTVASTMIIQLSLGADDPNQTLPVRGGIDLAIGTVLQPENFLYSAAYLRAYCIECQKAIYPRTVAGERLMDYLNHLSGDSMEIRYHNTLVTRIRSMFFQDMDGSIVLDFLGDAVRESLGQSRDGTNLVANAWNYVKAAYAAHRESGDERLIAKYEWLIDYMKPRLRSWRVEE